MIASSSPAQTEPYMTVIGNGDTTINESYLDPNDRTLTACSPNLLDSPPPILPLVHGNGTTSTTATTPAARRNFVLGQTITNGIHHVPNPMEESILIQPEFQRMEISNNGHVGGTTASHIINTTSSHRRRRNSANSRPNGPPSFPLNNGR